MNTIYIVLISTGLFVAVQPRTIETLPEKTVSQLINDSPDNFGLINYFNELNLTEHCKSPIIVVNKFKISEHVDIVPCLCTVIYNMTKELEHIVFETSDVNVAKNKTNNYKSKNEMMYNMWKDVSKISPSLKFLMDPLNTNKWNILCHNIDEVIYPYCKFLNVEILLLHNTKQILKESIKETVTVVVKTEKGNGPNTSNALIPKESIKLDNLPEFIGSPNEYSGDIQKAKAEVNTNDNESSTYNKFASNNKEDENINEDELEKPIMNDIQTDSKINSKSSDDYPQEDNFIPPYTETKETQLMFNQKNTLMNHDFGDVDDSHFLFYFAIMTVLSMLFYLALYNKKKIIALMIEGRRSTNHRRRPNTASYSKVETDDGSTVF